MEDRTITDVFLNPLPDEVDAVKRERVAGLDELELVMSGLISLEPVSMEAEGENN